MSANDSVVYFGGKTRIDSPADKILDDAKAERIRSAVVIGWDAEGGFYFASSLADGGSVLWLLEMAKAELLQAGRE